MFKFIKEMARVLTEENLESQNCGCGCGPRSNQMPTEFSCCGPIADSDRTQNQPEESTQPSGCSSCGGTSAEK